MNPTGNTQRAPSLFYILFDKFLDRAYNFPQGEKSVAFRRRWENSWLGSILPRMIVLVFSAWEDTNRRKYNAALVQSRPPPAVSMATGVILISSVTSFLPSAGYVRWVV